MAQWMGIMLSDVGEYQSTKEQISKAFDIKACCTMPHIITLCDGRPR